MKPMLKKDFFSLVNQLLEAGFSPELQVSTLTCWGNLRWVDDEGNRQARSLYSSHDCSPLTASIHRKRFAKWFEEIIQKHQEKQEAEASIKEAHIEALEINKLVDEAVAFGTYSTNPNLTHIGVRNAIDHIRKSLLSLNRYPARFIVKMMISVRRLTKLANEAAQDHYRKMLSRPAPDSIDTGIPF